MHPKQIERFWNKVNKHTNNDCWLWTGANNGNGYGLVSLFHTMYLAHRISWELSNGLIPEGGLVLHKCNVRLCVNPSHLYIGNYSDNTNDIYKSNRQADQRGARGGSKLKECDVIEIRKLRQGGMAYPKIAKIYKVHRATIRSACIKKTWAYLN